MKHNASLFTTEFRGVVQSYSPEKGGTLDIALDTPVVPSNTTLISTTPNGPSGFGWCGLEVGQRVRGKAKVNVSNGSVEITSLVFDR